MLWYLYELGIMEFINHILRENEEYVRERVRNNNVIHDVLYREYVGVNNTTWHIPMRAITTSILIPPDCEKITIKFDRDVIFEWSRNGKCEELDEYDVIEEKTVVDLPINLIWASGMELRSYSTSNTGLLGFKGILCLRGDINFFLTRIDSERIIVLATGKSRFVLNIHDEASLALFRETYFERQ